MSNCMRNVCATFLCLVLYSFHVSAVEDVASNSSGAAPVSMPEYLSELQSKIAERARQYGGWQQWATALQSHTGAILARVDAAKKRSSLVVAGNTGQLELINRLEGFCSAVAEIENQGPNLGNSWESVKTMIALNSMVRDQGSVFTVCAIPAKWELYPAEFGPQPAVPTTIIRDLFLFTLLQNGVPAIDLHPNLAEAIAEERKVYYVSDCHWTDEGIAVATSAIGDLLKLWGVTQGLPHHPFSLQPVARHYSSPLLRMADSELKASYGPEDVQGIRVFDEADRPYRFKQHTEAPILVVGDSFMMYSNADDGTFAAQLAARLQSPVSGFARGGFVSDITEFTRDKEMLADRRVVLRLLSARDVASNGLWKPTASPPVEGPPESAVVSVADLSFRPAKPNLLQNGSFEAWENDKVAAWTIQGDASKDQRAGQQGSSLKLLQGDSVVTASQTVAAVQPLGGRKVTVFIDAETDIREGLGLRLAWTEHGVSDWEYVSPLGRGEWESLVLERVMPAQVDDDTLVVAFRVNPGAKASILIDNAYLCVEDVFIWNASFEMWNKTGGPAQWEVSNEKAVEKSWDCFSGRYAAKIHAAKEACVLRQRLSASGRIPPQSVKISARVRLRDRTTVRMSLLAGDGHALDEELLNEPRDEWQTLSVSAQLPEVAESSDVELKITREAGTEPVLIDAVKVETL